MNLAEQIAGGDRRALARGLRMVEDRVPGWRELLRAVTPLAGRAHRIGITGAPGVGKSSLVNALITEARAAGRTVGVLAIDPSSPISGGALLGDRIRMNRHFLDDGVFVRSMATRGALGGLASATGDALDLMDAAGFDLVLLETAGAGQTDIEVMGEAETVLVVLAPGAGDHIQAMKSGILEIATLWIVNKGDDPRAVKVREDLLAALSLQAHVVDAEERVMITSTVNNEGLASLLAALDARHAHLDDGGGRAAFRRRRVLARLRSAVRERVESVLEVGAPTTDRILDEVRSGRLGIQDAADQVLTSFATLVSENNP